jgi:hypothetical protein
MNDERVAWRSEGDQGHLSCGPLAGRIALRSLGQFALTHWKGRRCDSFFVLATDALQSLDVREHYVREQDFVATFAPKLPGNLTPQVYWRARLHASPRAVQIEMILSLHTDLLDSRPETTVQSVAAGSRLFHCAGLEAQQVRELTSADSSAPIDCQTSREHLFLFRNEAQGLTYAEMVHPTDFVQAQRMPEPPPHLVSTLFPDRLEKGVIRRARISGWFLPAENDLEVACDLAQKFVHEPLPLTA